MSRLLFVEAILAGCLSSCSSICDDEIIWNRPSPDGKYEAVLVIANCGATADFATRISVVRKGTGLHWASTAFVSDTNHGATARYLRNGAWADANWVGNDRLLIRYAAGSRVFRSRDQINGVRISYEIANR